MAPARIALDPDLVRTRLAQGYSVDQVADDLGLSGAKIRRTMRDAGIPLPGHNKHVLDLDRLKSLLAEGYGRRQIAVMMGVNVNLLRDRMRAAGLRMDDFSTATQRLRAARAQAPAPSAPPVARIAPPPAAPAPVAPDADAALLATGGRYAAIAAYAADRGLTITQALQRWHRQRPACPERPLD